MPTTAPAELPATLGGTLHVFVALDWGDEVDLAAAARLVPAQPQSLPRRRRTPPSIAYHPLPLRFELPPVALDLAELGPGSVAAEVTVFDFGAVSVAFRVPWQLEPAALTRLAASLAAPEPLLQAARAAAQPLYERLLPAIAGPAWSELSEEYFVLQVPPQAGLPPAETLLAEQAAWLAGLVRLEAGPLSRGEIEEALRQRISYRPDDLAVVEWSAAVLVDADCEESLQAIELANLQLLEYRHIDRRVDDALAQAYGQIHPLARSWLPQWRSHAGALRALGDIRIEAATLAERASNALKLLGDQYLARLYRLVATRLRLDPWAESIRGALDVAQGAYQILAEQAAAYRIEMLEIIIIVLILVEVMMAVWP